MYKLLKLHQLLCVAAALGLGTAAFAGSSDTDTWDAMGGWMDTTTDWETVGWPMMPVNEPEYMLTETSNHPHHNRVEYWFGVDDGMEVSSEGNLPYDVDCVKGDTLTNLQTHQSGVITGIKRQGTMDVMKDSGKTVRYQYVTFKVHPTK